MRRQRNLLFLFAALALVDLKAASAAQIKKIGIQLYSIRDKVSSLGFRAV